MSEPTHSAPDPPRLRFRFRLRAMIFVVAVLAVLFGLWIPTIRLLGWAAQFDDGFVVIAVFFLLPEAMVVYYVALAGAIAFGLVKPAGISAAQPVSRPRVGRGDHCHDRSRTVAGRAGTKSASLIAGRVARARGHVPGACLPCWILRYRMLTRQRQ